MGNLCSKCVGKEKKKQKYAQNEQVDSGKILTNKGITIDPRDVSDEAVPEVKKMEDKKQPEERTEKRKGDSSKRKTKTRQQSSESSSSSSSSSSDSDNPNNRRRTSNRKNYNSSKRGTTIVSKTFNNFGTCNTIKNVDNVVINIGSGGPRAKKKKPEKNTNQEKKADPKPESCKEFSGYYPFQETPRETLVNVLSPIIDPIGFLVHDNSTLVDAHKSKKVLEMAGSICKLVYPIGVTTGFATGIRVGQDKVMVPVHALKGMFETDHQDFASFHGPEITVCAPLERDGVFAKFSYDTSNTEPLKFYFDGNVHFWDEETDIAVVSLKHNPDGPPMPEPFKNFTVPNKEFILIGHSNGEPATTEAVKNIVKLTEETKTKIDELRKWSLDKLRRKYDDDKQADSLHRLLFQSSMIHGASGSPGLVVVDGEHVAVATIFIHKYPDLLYDQEVPQSQKDQVPKNYCISQGANMFSVYEKMRSDQPDLCDEIFSSWQ